MRFIHIALFAAVLAASFSCAAPEPLLQASASEAILDGWSCAPSGGPAQYYANIYVENPYSTMMYVNYSHYDYYLEDFVDGGRFCAVPAMGGQHCFLTIPVTLGGEVAGEAALPVRLTAKVDGMGGQMSKELIFTIRHSPPSTELSVLNMIATTQERISERMPASASVCTADGNLCCGMAGFRENLDSAGASLTAARELVRQCRFTEAVASASRASENVNEVVSSYNSTLKSCRRALQSYSDAYGNFTSANLTVFRRATCGINASDSRAELSIASSMLTQAADLIRGDAYADALLYAEQARMSTAKSLELSDTSCPPVGLEPSTPSVASTPELVQTPPPASGGDMLSGAFSALGYIVIAAIIIVVGAAIYVSLGKKHIDGFISRGPKIFEGFGKPPPSPPSGGEELPPMDHSKVEEEFQDWLKSSGMDDKGEKKKGKAK